ncbi:MAG TPA: ABC transporter ATP-binding protein [Candidatus Acidoferrales bacterium]|nr:ABC transporter ATP-binding protein [Candidatus Acidoferrales bacterium]
MPKLPGELRRLLRYVRPYRGRVAIAVVLLAVVGLAEGVTALMMTPAVDRVLNPATTDPTLPLVKLPFRAQPLLLNSFFPQRIRHVWTVFAISLVALFLAKALAEFFGSLLVQYVGHAAITDLRNDVYGKILRQPIGFFQHHPGGRLMSAVINDVERVRSALSEWLADFFRQAFTMVALILVLLLVNWRMALVSVVLVPVVVWPIGKLGRRIRRSTERSQSRLGELSQILQETVSGNRVVKAFGMENFEIRKFRAMARRLLRENMRWVSAHLATSPLMELLGAVVFVLILLYARDQIRAHVMTTGTFVTFMYALFKVYEPVKRMGIIYQQFQQALGASTEVFTFLSLEQEVAEVPGAKALPPFSREVEFRNVGFAYDAQTPILRSINLTARAGEVIAIVGSSGAGKTTLVNLLLRFYDVSSGAVRIDGYDVRDVTLRSLREQIAIVTQETILFNDTVWNNICYGRPELPETRVFAAARAALAHDFILELPQGYQSILGDRGQRLSGGQRQRLAIARALLKDSPILILDEATSELDSESEMLVQRALANLMVGRTVFVIAHRLSTIRRADRIVVLEDGTIRETGTHQELLERSGLYARLYELQFVDADTAPYQTGAVES